ncbi:MAG: hypothetical protein MK137_01040 [Rickettsiales bacterium]|nr:hypothetical protein [Rickettsiales bacterium]
MKQSSTVKTFLILTLSLLMLSSIAQISVASELPVPRFVSLKSKESNFRIGPSVNYPIKWVYVRRGMPIEIISEFANWRKVRDIEGEVGWIHHSLLSGKRNAIVIGNDNQPLRAKAESTIVEAYLEPGLIVAIDECEASLCKVKTEDYDGYVQKQALWGVYEDEIIN